MKQILFITSANLASNPRLVKELKLALANGYQAGVVQFYINNWSDGMTDELKLQFAGVKFTELSAIRKPFLPWFISTVAQKIFSFLPVEIMNTQMLSVVAGKRSLLLLSQLKKMNQKVDWVIAHNPAAFYPAYWYAKKTGASLGIDVEDYHPGETDNVKAASSMRKLMQQILPFANYCSYAAPLIAAEVKKDIPQMNNPQLTILNGFDAEEFIQPTDHKSSALQLVWFSQNIDAGRGLEHVIPVVNELFPAVELHLIGNLKQEFANLHLQNRTGIVIHAPMPQEKLHAFLAKFDVGLATDIPVNRNRELALTNKIIAYTQAGLYIAAMHTLAQDDFLKESDLQHELMENDALSIRKAFINLYQKKKNAELYKQEQFQKGQSYAWQKLSHQLVSIWENV